MARTILALVALAWLAGCGSDPDGTDGDRADLSGTSLTIIVTTDEGASPSSMTLECDPAGGDHPQPAEACEVLAEAGADVFAPVDADQACTEIHGGPQTADVRGSYEGTRVSATFDRTNGCEIDRWERLGTTFFAVPLQ